MSNSGDPIVVYCLSCGSPITMRGQRGTCSFCGTTVEHPANAPQPPTTPFPQPTPSVTMSSLPPNTPVVPIPYSRPRFGCGCMFSLLMLVIMLATAFGIGMAATNGKLLNSITAFVNNPTHWSAALDQMRIGSITKLAAILPNDSKNNDILVYNYLFTSENYTVARISGDTKGVNWQSPQLSKDAYQGVSAVGRDFIYITDRQQLIALRSNDGSIAWQAALEVEPQNSCETCLRLVDDYVIVLEKNGGVQAFAAQNGQPVWKTRLENTPQELLVAGDLIVTRRSNEEHKGQIIALLDPASGEPQVQIEPQCSQTNQFQDHEQPDGSTPLLFSADGKTLYMIYGFFTQCAQAYDLGSGTLRWDVELDRTVVPASWTNNNTLLTEDTIYLTNDTVIWALDTVDGSYRQIIADKEYRMQPLAAQTSTLLVMAAPTWDSQRQEIWGVELNSGERIWQQQLQAHDLYEGRSSGDWDWQLTPQAVVVFQVLRDTSQLIVEAYDLRSGNSIYQQKTELNMLIPSLYGVLSDENTAWLRIDNQIYAIDLLTGKVSNQL